MGRRGARTGATSCACAFSCVPSTGVRVLLSSLTCAFASGAIGGVVHFALGSLIQLAQIQGLQQLAFDGTLPTLYKMVVLGGLWGFLFIFRVGSIRHMGLQALVYGLVPTAVSLIRLYSHAGLGLPPLVPVYEFLMNTVGWSLPALSWFLMLSYEDAEDVEEQWQRTAQSRGNILSPGGPSLSNPMLV